MCRTGYMRLFFFDNLGCPGQLTRTTTNPRAYWTSCKPNRQVRYRGGDRLVHGEDQTRDSHEASFAVDHWARPWSVGIWDFEIVMREREAYLFSFDTNFQNLITQILFSPFFTIKIKYHRTHFPYQNYHTKFKYLTN